MSFYIRDGFSLKWVFNNSCFFFDSVFTDFSCFYKHIVNIFGKRARNNIKNLIWLWRRIKYGNRNFAYIRLSDFIRFKWNSRVIVQGDWNLLYYSKAFKNILFDKAFIKSYYFSVIAAQKLSKASQRAYANFTIVFR